MNQVTKKQHYVWRYYLSPWTDNNSSTGRIVCLRNNKVFIASLTNVAHENYFYEVKRLSEKEINLIYLITSQNASGTYKAIIRKWIDLFCAPFDLADYLTPFFPLMNQRYVDPNQVLKDLSIEHIEQFHGLIEKWGISYLELLRQGDIHFWHEQDNRDRFAFFLCVQYFRTKRIRDNIIFAFRQVIKDNMVWSDIHPENMWIPLSLILATRVGVYISQKLSPVILWTPNDEGCFIVGDQPVVNTYSTFDSSAPDKMELFYPISPNLALLLTEKAPEGNIKRVAINRSEIERYNMIEFKSSCEQIFAKDKAHLDAVIQ